MVTCAKFLGGASVAGAVEVAVAQPAKRRERRCATGYRSGGCYRAIRRSVLLVRLLFRLYIGIKRKVRLYVEQKVMMNDVFSPVMESLRP